MDKFKYLGVMISTDGGMGEEGAHRVLEGRNVLGTSKIEKGTKYVRTRI